MSRKSCRGTPGSCEGREHSNRTEKQRERERERERERRNFGEVWHKFGGMKLCGGFASDERGRYFTWV